MNFPFAFQMMKPSRNTNPCPAISGAAGALCMFLGTQGAEPAVAAATIPKPASAGAVNDWLRLQNGELSVLDLGGQFRTRFEYRDQFGIAGVPGSMDFRSHGADTENTYGLFRTRIHLGWSPVEWSKFYVEGRDSFSLGDDRRPNPESDRIDLHQAYLGLGNTNQFPVSLKLGRQELSYGDERLVGAFDWNNIGRVFDAAKLRYDNTHFWLDGFVGRVVIPDDHNLNLANDYDFFSELYLSSRSWCPVQETQFYFLARNTGGGSPTTLGAGLPALLNGASPRDIYTLGTRVKSIPGRLGPWDYSLELAGQFGRYKDSVAGPSLEQRAYAAHAAAGYTFTAAAGKPRLGLEYDFSSGDGNSTDGTHETFDNLFPTNHRFYGYMDLFSWQNMHNLRATASIKPLSPLTLTLDGHLFWLADTHDNFYTVSGGKRPAAAVGSGMGFAINPGYGNYVGSEVDLTLQWTIRPYASAQAGIGRFFVGDYVTSSLKNPLFGASDANFAYLQLTLNF